MDRFNRSVRSMTSRFFASNSFCTPSSFTSGSDGGCSVLVCSASEESSFFASASWACEYHLRPDIDRDEKGATDLEVMGWVAIRKCCVLGHRCCCRERVWRVREND